MTSLCLALFTLLGACGGGTAQPSQMIKLKVANPSAAAPGAILQVTKDAGLFTKYGLDVDLSVISGAQNLLASLLSNETPITMQASPSVIQAQLSGADIVMFAGIVNTTFFTIFSRPDINSIQELKGKKVGSTPGGGADEAAVDLALKTGGLSLKDVTIINLPQPARLEALQNGAVDAVSITLPFTLQARKMGFHEVVDVAAMHLDYQNSTFVTSRSYLKDQRDVVVRFMRGISEGIKFYKTHPDESKKSLATFTSSNDPEVLDETYKQFALNYTSKVPYLSVTGLQYVLDNSIDDPKVKGHKPEDFIDQSVVKQLDDEGLYKQLWGNDTSGT